MKALCGFALVASAVLVGTTKGDRSCIGTLQNRADMVSVVSQVDDTPASRALDLELVSAFAKRRTDLNVQYAWTHKEDMKKDLDDYLSLTRNGPDVVGWYAGGAVSRALSQGSSKKAISGEGPQHTELTSSKLYGLGNVFERENLYEVIEAGLLRSVSDQNGEPYVLPVDYYHWGVYYNEELMEELDISVPIKNWTDFLSACQIIQAAGITPISLGNKFLWPAAGWFDYLNMRLNGPDFHINVTNGDVKYDDKRVRAVFELWNTALVSPGFYGNVSEIAERDIQGMADDLTNKRAGFALMGDFIRQYAGDAQLDWFQFPVMDPTLLIGEDAPSDGYIIPFNAPNKSRAEDLITFYASEEYQTGRLDVTAIPANLLSQKNITDEKVARGAQMIRDADRVLQFYDRDSRPAMAKKGMEAMARLVQEPDRIDKELADLEHFRQEYHFGYAGAPQVSHDSGRYMTAIDIEISLPEGSAGTVYYTLDGSLPTTQSRVYTSPIKLMANSVTTLRCVNIAKGLYSSPVVQRQYNMEIVAVTTLSSEDAQLVSAILGSIGLCYTLVLMGFVYKYRSEPIVQVSSPIFLGLALLGVAIALCALVAELSGNCMLPVWLLAIGYAIGFGSVFFKTLRIFYVFRNANKMRRRPALTNKQLLSGVCFLVAVEVLILTAWQIADPLVRTAKEIAPFTFSIVCSSEDHVWKSLLMIINALLLIAAVVVCFKSRASVHIPAFDESKEIGFAIYNLALLTIITMAISLTASADPTSAKIIASCGVLITSIVIASSLTLRKFYIIHYRPENNVKENWFKKASSSTASSKGDPSETYQMREKTSMICEKCQRDSMLGQRNEGSSKSDGSKNSSSLEKSSVAREMNLV